jgi:hypothetical protein
MIHTIKCFSKVTKTSTKVHFIMRAHKISSVNLYKALSVVTPFQNPNCSSVRILIEFKKLINQSKKSVAHILENDVSKLACR